MWKFSFLHVSRRSVKEMYFRDCPGFTRDRLIDELPCRQGGRNWTRFEEILETLIGHGQREGLDSEPAEDHDCLI